MSNLPPVPDSTFAAAHIPAEVDVVLCGGGTVASIIASRLSAADPNLRVLLLEMGPPTLNDNMHIQPAMYAYHLRPGSQTVRIIEGQPNPDLDGRRLLVPHGQCIGGGSSVNFAMYTRAAASDYDDWETVHGNQGWGSKDLIPLIQKSETYQVAPSKETHGYNGPLNISYGGVVSNIGIDFIDAAHAFDKDRSSGEDGNAFYESNIYARWQKYIDGRTGRRSDIAHNYLYPLQGNSGLTIATGVIVRRVLFEETKATGVEFQYNAVYHGAEKAQGTHTVTAKKLVIVSAGAFGSPGILERSGIGAKKVLGGLDIKTIVELDGVGENYQDHHLVFSQYNASPESETLDAIQRLDPEAVKEATSIWEQTGKGPMSTNGIDAAIKYRFTPQDLEELGSAYKKRWDSYLANAKDKSAVIITPIATLAGADPSLVPPSKYYSFAIYTMYPLAVGSVHISSATDPLANPIFHDNFFAFEEDYVVLVWAYKQAREIGRRMASYRGEVTSCHPKFPKGSEAETQESAQPVPYDTKKITYTKEDDKAILEYLKQQVNTTWHSLGTCPMKARQAGGVVDNRLNVYGTTSLKVADLSICPSNVAANTYGTAIAVGERAAVIIAEDLGIKLN